MLFRSKIGNFNTEIGQIVNKMENFSIYSGLSNNTWVDPGVYAVCIPLIGFGSVLPMLEANQEDSDD